MVLRKVQKVANALPARSEIIDLNVAESDCLNSGCQSCENMNLNKVESGLKSISSSINSEATLSSGRSFFPGKEELQQMDVLPDLTELKDRLTAKQLD